MALFFVHATSHPTHFEGTLRQSSKALMKLTDRRGPTGKAQLFGRTKHVSNTNGLLSASSQSQFVSQL